MKIGNDYWYNHSKTNVRKSPYRKEVVNPSGNFIFNGQSLPRLGDPETIRTLISQKIENKVPLPSVRCSSPIRKYCPDNYYNRLKTPTSEEELLQNASIRKEHILEFKHLFHDDNFKLRPVTKYRKVEIFLPSKNSIDFLDNMVNRKVIPEKE